MNLSDCGKQLTKDKINDFEKVIKLKLPSGYRDFLMKHNGGVPLEDLAYNFVDVVTEKNNSSDIREFFVFYENETENYDDIIHIHKNMTNEKTIPVELLPIGDDSAGNPLCISLLPNEDYGKIYFCNHEIENKKTGYLAMSKIANSFEEFLNMLYISN